MNLELCITCFNVEFPDWLFMELKNVHNSFLTEQLHTQFEQNLPFRFDTFLYKNLNIILVRFQKKGHGFPYNIVSLLIVSSQNV
jgi:hypothetical protein